MSTNISATTMAVGHAVQTMTPSVLVTALSDDDPLDGHVADPGIIWWHGLCGNVSIYNAFWSSHVMLTLEDPDVTYCLEQTVLTWATYGFFVVVGLIYLPYLMCQKPAQSHIRHRPSVFNIFKTIVAMLLVVVELSGDIGHIMIDVESGGTHLLPSDYIAMTLRFVALSLATCLIPLEFTRGIVSSGILSVFWTALLWVEALFLYSAVMRYLNDAPIQSMFLFVNSCISFPLVVIEFISCMFGDPRAHPSSARVIHPEHMPLLHSSDEHSQGSKPEMDDPYKFDFRSSKEKLAEKSRRLNPMLTCSFYVRVTFGWFAKFRRRSRGQPYTFDELPQLRPEDSTHQLLPKFYLHYHPSLKRLEAMQPGPLVKALLWTLRGDLFLAVTYRLFNIGAAFLIPALLQMFIYYMEEHRKHWGGYVLATFLHFASYFNIIFVNNFLFMGSVAGMKARSVVSALIYRKLMAVSSTVSQRTNLQHIVEILSLDCENVQEFFLFVVILITTPLLLLVTLTYMWMLVGVASLTGPALLMIVVPINALCFSTYAKRKMKRQMKMKTERLKLIDELVDSMQAIKSNTWEEIFKKRITELRRKELKAIRQINCANIYGTLCWLVSPYLVSLAVFLVYMYVLGDRLEATKVFVTLTLINLLTWPLSLIPMAITNTMKGWVSIKKIAKLLATEERDDADGDDNRIQFGSEYNEMALSLRRASFSWGRLNRPSLRNIDFDVPRGTLVAIVGLSGSGKSSLLKAILGELYRVDGEAHVNGSTAYVTQRPWILEGSFRDNILLYQVYNEERFNKICHACHLAGVISTLPHGTRTHIAPHTPLLTKAQAQCLALARAIYQDKSIYLLDDSLSFLPDEERRDIFDQVIGPEGLLRRKTRILVTHDATLLPSVDYIYYLDNGYIKDYGTYGKLLARDADLADFIRSYIVVENPTLEFDDIRLRDIRGHLAKLRGNRPQSATERAQMGKSKGRFRNHSHFLNKKSDEARSDYVALQQARDVEEPLCSWSLRCYLRAGGWPAALAIVVLLLALGTAQFMTNFSLHSMSHSSERISMAFTAGGLTNYGIFGAVQVALALMVAILLTFRGQSASRNLHQTTLQSLLHAPMRYFYTRSSREASQLFSKHIGNVDLTLPAYLRQWLFALAAAGSTLALLIYLVPWIAVVVVPLVGWSFYAHVTYSRVLKQLKNLDRRQPFYEFVGRSFIWSTCIRTYDMEGQFMHSCNRLIDNMQRPYFLTLAAYRWCGLVVEVLCNFLVFVAGILAAWYVESFSGGEVGIIVTFALMTTLYMNALVRNTIELETNLTSVGHIEAACNIEQEFDLSDPSDDNLPSHWPQYGNITFSEYTMNLPCSHGWFTINNLTVPAGRRVGLVGQCETDVTSFLMSIMRMNDYVSGNVHIDERDVSEVPLKTLRAKIGYLTQVPSLFSGDLRTNLDPGNEFSLEEIWQALEIANIKSYVENQPSGLFMQCGKHGEYLRPDVRQLVAIARALLQHQKIFLVDNVTSGLDEQTSNLILHLLRTHFTYATVIMSSQRLQELLDFDRIIVLENGRIVESGKPAKLMANQISLFRGMVRQIGQQPPAVQ